MASLQIGLDERNSAKKRRQDEYRKELQLQMRERDAARAREKLQDMSVNASGYLDPEKGPERLKGLGGGDFSPRKATRDVKVKPYHTLFLYDRDEEQKRRVGGGSYPASGGPLPLGGALRVPRMETDVADYGQVTPRRINVTNTSGLGFQGVTYATGTLGVPGSQDHAYHFYATRDITQPVAAPNIVQPLAPISDNRPIVVINRGSSSGGAPKYNPFMNNNGMGDVRDLITRSQLDGDKWRLRLQNQTDADKRRLQAELEEEQRRLRDREADAKRRLDELRREAEERRKEAERRRLELERLKLIRDAPATKVVPTHRPYSRTKLMDDMDDYSKRLREERWKVEEMLRNLKNAPPANDTLIIRRRRPPAPPTPKTADLANRENVQIFAELKHKDNETRDQFRNMFPEVPYTNKNLENQQDALLRQQESLIRQLKSGKVDGQEHLRWRPHWMYHNGASPFPDRPIHTSRSLDLELDRVGIRSSSRRMKRIDYSDDLDDTLRLHTYRPSSRDTLDDDTWMRPSSSDI